MIVLAHGRGQVQYVELGLKRDGTIVGMRCRFIGDAGAYAGFGGILVVAQTKHHGAGRLPHPADRVRRRGGDHAAPRRWARTAVRGGRRHRVPRTHHRHGRRRAGHRPRELRRRNLIRPDEFPYTTLMGANYDSGDYELAVDEALRIADYRRAARRAGRAPRRAATACSSASACRCYVEVTRRGAEFAEVEVHDDGRVTVQGGHLGARAGSRHRVRPDRRRPARRADGAITYVQSDTALVPRGGGTGGSRSCSSAAPRCWQTPKLVVEKAKALAAELLEAAPDDIVVVDDGRLGVAGVPSKALDVAELARTAAERGDPLTAQLDTERSGATFPFGAHVAVVEIDTETGRVTPLRHIAVDDCGVIVNPLLVDGQHARRARAGIAQALWEQMRLRRRRQPADVDARRLRDAQRGRAAVATRPSTPRDAVAAQRARREGDRRVGHRRLDARGAERGRRRPEPSRRAPRRHAVHAGAGVARDPGAKAGTLADPWREPPAAMASLPVEGAAEEALEHEAEEINL